MDKQKGIPKYAISIPTLIVLLIIFLYNLATTQWLYYMLTIIGIFVVGFVFHRDILIVDYGRPNLREGIKMFAASLGVFLLIYVIYLSGYVAFAPVLNFVSIFCFINGLWHITAALRKNIEK